MALERNMNRLDQGVRLAMGVGMLSMLYLVPESGYWGLLGVMPLASAYLGHCPSYRILGIRTNAAPEDEEPSAGR